MQEFWNERYSQPDYAYGKEPNSFFKDQLKKLSVGRILLPADGEGRNSVFAAKKGWEVHACDISEEGKNKALKLAGENEVSIDYKVGDFSQLEYKQESFDAIALIFAHFPPLLMKAMPKLINKYLKTGGYVILEAFNKDHIKFNSINPEAGGPKNPEMLYSIEELKNDFLNYKFEIARDTEFDFREGKYHNGRGSVCQFLAQKQK